MNRRIAILLCCLFCCGQVAAEGALRDPTRPPDTVSGSEADAGGSLRLDAVLRPVGGQPAAVINGETLRLGGEIQGLRLIAIKESEVVLKGPQGRETLRLAPAVDKKIHSNGGIRTIERGSAKGG